MPYTLTRRQLLRSLAVVTTPAILSARARAQSTPTPAAGPLSQVVLPQGVRSRFVNDVNGIRMHVLEAGFGSERRPAVLLVHGFPELAYSWRTVMLPIAAAGYHVIAPDLRGYGRTSGTDVKFDDDLSPWRTLNEVTDMVALVSAFGYSRGLRRHRPRLRIAGRRVVRCRAARYFPIGRADERAVRWDAPAAVRHRRRRAGERREERGERRHLRRSGEADAAAQALSALLLDAPGEIGRASCREIVYSAD